jgi:hypothetical protein
MGKVIHGMWKSKEWNAWNQMKMRCMNHKHKYYKDYGGRGIKVWERWNEFNNFFDDMGFAPSKEHSLDRINNDGNYEPSNCRWALPSVQASNRRCVVDSISSKARKAEFDKSTVIHRLKRGWTLEDALSIPLMQGKRRNGEG